MRVVIAILLTLVSAASTFAQEKDKDQLAEQAALIRAQKELLEAQRDLLGAQKTLMLEESKRRSLSLEETNELLKLQQIVLDAQIKLATSRRTLSTASIEDQKAVVDALKDLTQSQTALDTAEVKNEFAKYSALLEILGKLPETGKDGSVSIKKDGVVLLRSSVSVAEATEKAATAVCTKVQEAAEENKRRVAAREERQPDDAASKFILGGPVRLESAASAHVLKKALATAASRLAVELKKANPFTPFARSGVLSALPTAAIYANVLGNFTRIFREDRSLAVSDSSERFLPFFKDVLTRTCEQHIDMDLEFKSNPHIAKHLQSLTNEYLALSARQSQLTARRQAMSDQAAGKMPEGWTDVDWKKAVKTAREQIHSFDEALENAKATLALFGLGDSGKPDLLTPAAALAQEEWLGGKPRILITFLAEGIQDDRQSMFTSVRPHRSATVQVLFRAIDGDGRLLGTGYVSETTEESKIDLEKAESYVVPAPKKEEQTKKTGD